MLSIIVKYNKNNKHSCSINCDPDLLNEIIINYPLLVTEIRYSTINYIGKDNDKINSIFDNYNNITSLVIWNPPDIDLNNILIVIKKSNKLNKLCIDYNIYNNVIDILINYFENLTTISLMIAYVSHECVTKLLCNLGNITNAKFYDVHSKLKYIVSNKCINKLQKLTLSSCTFTKKELEYLYINSKNIQSLSIEKSHITSRFKINDNLRELKFSLNNISVNQIKNLSYNIGKLTKLYLQNSKIDDYCIKNISKNISNLVKLDLYRNKITHKSIIDIINNCDNLTYLNLSHNNLGDISLEYILSDIKKIKILNLETNKITGENIILPDNVNELCKLNLASNEITNNGFDNLIKIFNKIQKVYLAYNLIDIHNIGMSYFDDVYISLYERIFFSKNFIQCNSNFDIVLEELYYKLGLKK